MNSWQTFVFLRVEAGFTRPGTMIEQHKAVFYNGADYQQREDAIAVEVALSIALNGTPFTVTMQTPGRELDLARGLLFTEGVVTDTSLKPQMQVLEKTNKGHITALNVVLPSDCIVKDVSGTRNLVSTSSCGMCGKTSVDETKTQVNNQTLLDGRLVAGMFEQVAAAQNDFKQAGGTHAAGAFNSNGQLIALAEDIGRHNAVDKVIGYLLNNDLLQKASCLTVSGRVSYEIVNKARAAGIPFLAAVSAPSNLAIEKAEEAGITLMAFCRGTKFTIYTHPHQVSNASTALAAE